MTTDEWTLVILGVAIGLSLASITLSLMTMWIQSR